MPRDACRYKRHGISNIKQEAQMAGLLSMYRDKQIIACSVCSSPVPIFNYRNAWVC